MREWSPRDAIQDGFNKLKADPWGLAVPVFVVMLIQGIPNGFFGGVAGTLELAGEEAGEGGLLFFMIATLVRFVGSVVALLISAYLTGGMSTFFLKVARGQEYALADVFSGRRYYANMLVTLFLFQVLTSVGFLLLVVPGVVLMLGLQMAMLLVVDQDLAPIDALKESWRITSGHKVKLLGLVVVAMLIVMAGAAACGVGMFPAIALVMAAQAWVYVRLTENNPPPRTRLRF